MKKIVRTFALFISLAVSAAVLVAGGFTVWLFCTPRGAQFAVREVARATLGSKRVSWAKLEGSLASGISVRHLEARGLPYLPVNNFLRIQGMTIRLRSLSLKSLELMVEHGRLFPTGDGAIVFSARVVNGNFVVNAYTRQLHLMDVRVILAKFLDIPLLKGTLVDIDLTARGQFDSPQLQGVFKVGRIEKDAFVLSESPVAVDLSFVLGKIWETHGRMTFQGGQLVAPNKVTVDLTENTLTFQGDPQQPQLNLKGSTVVSRTKIDISVRGDMRAPKIGLSSDPPRSQDQLMMMLGLRDIVLSADQDAQGFMVNKGLSRRLDIGFGVKRQANATQPSALTQTVGSEFRVTNKVRLGVEKEIRTRSSTADPALSSTASTEQTNDRVYMQYKTNF